MKKKDIRDITQSATKIVIKVGSSLLMTKGRVDYEKIKKYSELIGSLKNKDKQLVLVTSGAVASSGKVFGQGQTNAIQIKQVLASIGQVHLMSMYSKAFKELKLEIGQILLSKYSISDDTSKQNAKNTLDLMLKRGITPIINENDTVATEELQFGDNDILGALVAGLIEADLYIILSDVDGFYTDYRGKSPKLETCITNINEKILQQAGGPSTVGTGGMYSKILAAKKCREFLIPTLITNGNNQDLYSAIFKHNKGTFFTGGSPQVQRKTSIFNGLRINVQPSNSEETVDFGGNNLEVTYPSQ